MYLVIVDMIGHFEEKNENKYLVLAYVNKNKEISKKIMKKFGKVLKHIKEIETINGGEKIE